MNALQTLFLASVCANTAVAAGNNIPNSTLLKISSHKDQEAQVKVTSIKENDCTGKIPKKMKEYFRHHGNSAVACPSFKGWQPYLVSDNERSWIEVVRGSSIWTTEKKIVHESIGNFPNIGGDDIEWILRKEGPPFAVIFRITAQDPELTGHISRLYVLALTEDTVVFCGIASTNKEARQIAISSRNCKETLPSRQLVTTGR